MTEFIFFFTHHDRTVEDAIEVFEEVKDTGLKYVGFKDVGLPDEQLRRLANLIKDEGMTAFMELVSYEREKHISTLMRANELGVDYLIGGMPPFTRLMRNLIQEKGIKIMHFPYVGYPVDHPCVLRGTIDYIIDEAKRARELGVNGINLLAYRYKDGNPTELITKFKENIDLPTIVAGSIDSPERIREVVDLRYWAFTIGGAIFEKRFVPEGNLRDQVVAVLEKLEQVEKR